MKAEQPRNLAKERRVLVDELRGLMVIHGGEDRMPEKVRVRVAELQSAIRKLDAEIGPAKKSERRSRKKPYVPKLPELEGGSDKLGLSD